MKHFYTTPRLDAIVFNESDAVRTSGAVTVFSEKGYKDIFTTSSTDSSENGKNS